MHTIHNRQNTLHLATGHMIV